MAKKLLSVILAVIMMFSCVAVASFAVDTTDYKYKIDHDLLAGYTIGNYSKYGTTLIPENITENIKYWVPEIQTAYYAATTNADYEALYNKMITPYNDPTEGNIDGMYKYRDESVSHIDIKNVAYSADGTTPITTVSPGDTFTIKVFVTNNYWMTYLGTGFYYETANVTPVSAKVNLYDATTNPTGNKGWDDVSNLHYGILNNGTDRRATYYWAESMRTTEKIAKYGCVRIQSSRDPDFVPTGFDTPRKFDNFLFATFTFKVSDTATAGSVVNFFLTDDSFCENYYDYNAYCPDTVVDTMRGTSATVASQVDDMCPFGQSHSFTNAQVTIVNKATAADYTALDAAIADKATLTEANYTPTSWATYAAAVTAGSAVSRTLTSDDQATINTAAKAITDAKAALVSKEVISAEVVGSPVLNANATVNVTVAGSPDKLNLVDADNVSTVFTRDDATITTSGNNEIWAIKVFASSPSKNYTVFASYGGTYFEGSSKTFTLTATQGLDLSIHSASVADMEDGYITAGRHTITVTTSTDVYKVQILDPNYNSTCTYSIDYTPYVDNGNVRTWTISYNFTPLGSMSNIFRTRAATTTFADTGSKLAATVVY
jgi:hypothetical protein